MFLSLEAEKFCSVRYFSYGNVSFLKIAVKCKKRSEQKCKLKNKRLGLSFFQLRTKKIKKVSVFGAFEIKMCPILGKFL